MVVQSTERDGGVPRGGEVLRAVALSNAAAVFAEGHVADVVQTVFDPPVAAVVGQELLRIGLVARQRRDAVSDFRGALPLAGLRVRPKADARDAEDLLHTRPAELLLEERVEFRGGLDGAMFATAVAFVPLLMKPSFGPPLPQLVGGKRPRPGR